MIVPRIGFRASLVLAHDVFAALVSWAIAYALRFNFEQVGATLALAGRVALFVVPVQAAIFVVAGLYQGMWRYASLPDFRRILVAGAGAALVAPVFVIFVQPEFSVPRSVLILAPVLMVGMMCASRLFYRMWREHQAASQTARLGQPVIILGAGAASVNLIKELPRSRHWRAVALLDDDRSKIGRVIQGVKVWGTIDEFALVSARFGTKRAVLAMPSAPHEVRRRIVEHCVAAGAEVLTVPAFEDLMDGRVKVDRIRKVEVEDLLGRDPVQLDSAGLKGLLAGRVVMVTGAGGSIGSELCRQIANFRPSLLVFFELSEFALYNLQEEFSALRPDVPVAAAVGDARNPARVGRVIEEYRPAVIFHAAAYKHVPLMEDVNAWEAVRNNAYGTYVVGSAAKRRGVEKFVLISTDKAVNPTNVMGASKRLAEMVCQALGQDGGTRFEMVRFGNVLGSAGSVIPKFQAQIARGGPITITHPDIIRYFMSIPEAAQLVLQAGLMGEGGEIFVLDMGQPVRIVDLARDMIRLSGFSEDEIQMVVTGLRPGEKLYEELLADDESTRETPHQKLRIARARAVPPEWLYEFLRWLDRGDWPADDEVRRELRRWVPEYSQATRPLLREVESGRAAR